MSDVAAVDAIIRLSRVLERASTDLSLAHFRVLSAVADGQQRASRLARRLALGKPAVSASVESLCRRGLLERQTELADQRAVTLRLTPEGERALAAARAAMVEQLRAVIAHAPVPAATVEQLTALNAGLDELAEQRAAR
ncbi:MarR family transcriptional regulator [Flexivirga oryzae]|uniref:DNA-binding MarR family transcriptional regulator n=1 Tax=Flexivirga oryzae TaxID=1794944 RepID=A0A839N2H9_9MICO|nr:DNA-binding MarR family transcriptional regulator [Flexivirga oryzae]